MKKKQAKAIIEIIREDAEVQYEYLDTEGQTCVLGGLGLKAGVSKKVLRACGDADIIGEREEDITDKQEKALVVLRKKIENAFGLTPSQMDKLQKINDNYYNTAERRSRLVSKINSWMKP